MLPTSLWWECRLWLWESARLRADRAALRVLRLVTVFGWLIVSGCGPVVPTDATGGGASDGGPAPVADASRTPTRVSTLGADAVAVVLNGDASRTASTSVEFAWEVDGTAVGTGRSREVTLPLGVYEVTLTISDGDGRTSSDSVTLTVVADLADEVLVAIGVSSGGVTEPPPGETVYEWGATVRLEAIPSPGFGFAGWTGDIDSPEATVVMTLTSDLSVTAEFVSLVAPAISRFFLPWGSGRTRRVGQGNDGPFSHSGLFAWDFPMRVGTPVVATAAGRVIEVIEKNQTQADGAPALTETDFANLIRIDHGRGLQSVYVHLDFEGALVATGQDVVRGQVIGYSGNTGFSTGPHLHYEVVDGRSETTSSGFFEVGRRDGIPLQEDQVTSANVLNAATMDAYSPSSLPADAFDVNQIVLTGDLPPAFFYDGETDYTVTGEVLNGASRVCVALVDPEAFDTVFCDLTDVAPDGTFVHTFRFPATLSGAFFFGVISGDGGAEGQAAHRILIAPPIDRDRRPIARAAAGTSETIEYFQDHPLRGAESFSPDGKPLAYQWAQVSGPPAVVADSTRAETSFFVQPDDGIDRVAFQLVVSDGVLSSFPDEIAFKLRDAFFVTQIGISDSVCFTLEECQTQGSQPPLIALTSQTVQGWVELVNVERGDLLEMTIADPNAAVVLSGEATIEVDAGAASFWRFLWSSTSLSIIPGDWMMSLRRNGRLEASIPFRVVTAAN